MQAEQELLFAELNASSSFRLVNIEVTGHLGERIVSCLVTYMNHKEVWILAKRGQWCFFDKLGNLEQSGLINFKIMVHDCSLRLNFLNFFEVTVAFEDGLKEMVGYHCVYNWKWLVQTSHNEKFSIHLLGPDYHRWSFKER
jgi:hypothetical protein